MASPPMVGLVAEAQPELAGHLGAGREGQPPASQIQGRPEPWVRSQEERRAGGAGRSAARL